MALLLGGCLDGSDPEPTTSTTSTQTFTAIADPGFPVGEPLTDILYLLDSPHVTAAVPTGTDPMRVPVTSTAVPVTIDGASPKNWTLPRPGTLDFVLGTALIYIDVQGVVSNPSPADECFWRFNLYVPAAAGSGNVGVGTDHSVCKPEPAVVQPGVRELSVSFPGQPVPDGAGDRLVLVITSNAVMGPGATVDVLAGSVDYPSRVTINGLQVPLTTQTLLL